MPIRNSSLAMGLNKITGVADGTDDNDAVNVSQLTAHETPDASVTYAKLNSALVASAADYRAATTQKLLPADNVWSAAALVTLTDAATVAVDFSAGFNFFLTLGGNRTLGNPSNMKAGQSGIIAISQDGTGSRTLAFDTYWKFPNGVAPTLTTTASRIDMLSYVVLNSVTIYAVLNKDFY